MVGWLGLRLWLFYRVYRRRIASLDRDWCDYCRHQTRARGWMKKHHRDFLSRKRLPLAGPQKTGEAWAKDFTFDERHKKTSGTSWTFFPKKRASRTPCSPSSSLTGKP
ncbi:MAG: hypothetical protein CM15mP128_2790 [Methanobacteriota archaeon]|nr:MAG: hypothetical protein CM15mP128_2790 [Euryarchaeota archaeon]